ncbi:hypothetical protein AB205_0045860 [Aquarana catesbeiana]|uniref:Uncharacterized protein n=1 Tax=Aquarana catesbeiana TaxID=8400 RepID=A0A2G9S392_AQUCT|nr:hypothetical protein AB205_0045860 [Aquarana catesbeiana]
MSCAPQYPEGPVICYGSSIVAEKHSNVSISSKVKKNVHKFTAREEVEYSFPLSPRHSSPAVSANLFRI